MTSPVGGLTPDDPRYVLAVLTQAVRDATPIGDLIVADVDVAAFIDSDQGEGVVGP